MNQSETIQKLVDMLGRSENDPELQALFIELGEKFPLKRPRCEDSGCLLENSTRAFDFGMKYAQYLPFFKANENFKKNEMVFYSLQGIYFQDEYQDVLYPFNIHWNLNPNQAIELLGDYFKYNLRKPDNSFLWQKGQIIILLEFDEDDCLCEICYRLITNYDLEVLSKQPKMKHESK